MLVEPFGADTFDDSAFGNGGETEWPEFPAAFSNAPKNNSSFNSSAGASRSVKDPFSPVHNGSSRNGFGNNFHVSAEETNRQESIQELIITEEKYMADMGTVKQVRITYRNKSLMMV